jgi:hypothetical protein
LSWHLDPAPWRFAGNSRESPGGTPPARSVIINSEFNNGFVSGRSKVMRGLRKNNGEGKPGCHQQPPNGQVQTTTTLRILGLWYFWELYVALSLLTVHSMYRKRSISQILRSLYYLKVSRCGETPHLTIYHRPKSIVE